GVISALALVGHSFTDGVGIGIAFRISEAIGLTVAAAVLAHDFADGFNTVNIMVTHANTRRRSLVLLICDAVAPIVATLLALALPVPEHLLTLDLGFFAGYLLHICTTHLSPEEEEERQGSTLLEIFLICAGVAFALVVRAALPEAGH